MGLVGCISVHGFSPDSNLCAGLRAQTNCLYNNFSRVSNEAIEQAAFLNFIYRPSRSVSVNCYCLSGGRGCIV